jgi:hypothetical protein
MKISDTSFVVPNRRSDAHICGYDAAGCWERGARRAALTEPNQVAHAAGLGVNFDLWLVNATRRVRRGGSLLPRSTWSSKRSQPPTTGLGGTHLHRPSIIYFFQPNHRWSGMTVTLTATPCWLSIIYFMC